jgi:lipoprotein-releasing system permease protein
VTDGQNAYDRRSIGLLKSAPLLWALPLAFLRRPGASRLNRVFRYAAFVASLIGTLSVLLVLAGTHGTDTEIKSKIAGLDSHILLRMSQRDRLICPYPDLTARLGATPAVVAVAPFLWTDALIASDKSDSLPITLKGVDAASEARATDVNRYVRDANMRDIFARPSDSQEIPLIIGSALANSLRLSRGDKVSITKPGPMSSRRFSAEILALFDSGTRHDNEIAYTTLAWAQRLQGAEPECVNAIAVRTPDPFTSSGVATAMQLALGGDYEVEDWSSRAPNYKALIDLLRFWLLLLTQTIFFRNRSGGD